VEAVGAAEATAAGAPGEQLLPHGSLHHAQVCQSCAGTKLVMQSATSCIDSHCIQWYGLNPDPAPKPAQARPWSCKCSRSCNHQEAHIDVLHRASEEYSMTTHALLQVPGCMARPCVEEAAAGGPAAAGPGHV
jgi:hypothetical protein